MGRTPINVGGVKVSPQLFELGRIRVFLGHLEPFQTAVFAPKVGGFGAYVAGGAETGVLVIPDFEVGFPQTLLFFVNLFCADAPPREVREFLLVKLDGGHFLFGACVR